MGVPRRGRVWLLMRCVWVGTSGAPATNSTNYQLVSATLQWPWLNAENATNGFGGRSVPITENIVITKLTMWIGTAPGGATSWTFKIRSNAADTAASLSIAGAATTATWTGRVTCNISDLVCLSSTPTGGPAGAVRTYWNIEYYTTGNYYLVVSANNGPSSGTGTYYYSAFGGSSSTSSTTNTTYESVIPTNLAVTKIATICDQSVGGTYTYTVRNNTTATDSSFSAAVTTFQGISATGSLAFSPGDTIVIKEVRSGSAWAAIRSCFTVAASAAGEIAMSYGHTSAPSTTVTNYELPYGGGSGAWNATETAVYMRMPASTLKKFYIKLTTAPGASKSRAFTIRSDTVDTIVTATVTGAVATANNTTDSAIHVDGNFLSVSTTPTGTPTATAGVKLVFVQVIHQRNGDFFSTF